jgi:excisionase family DNA binding protein
VSAIIEKGAMPARRGRPPLEFERHYTVNETCSLLAIDRSTFYRWLRDGVFDYVVKTPGGTRIPAGVLRRFSDERRVSCRGCSS